MRCDNSSSSSSLDFSFGLEQGASGGGGSNVVTSTQTCAAFPKEKEDGKPAKLSERTLSALREFQASQPILGEVKGQSDAEESSSKEGRSDPEGSSTTQPKTLQSIFADPNDDFDFEL